ncbi:hypothetical protein NQ317_003475 [Molorchus minor]|uniref:Uncharacterized protein n=1 Tax=Molorchus minor TaxID=1323400 RepID=A0ABQ9JZA6_9CUCU|nr:hypothetical protein NQ317_003475 [Molorchus minor]
MADLHKLEGFSHVHVQTCKDALVRRNYFYSVSHADEYLNLPQNEIAELLKDFSIGLVGRMWYQHDGASHHNHDLCQQQDGRWGINSVNVYYKQAIMSDYLAKLKSENPDVAARYCQKLSIINDVDPYSLKESDLSYNAVDFPPVNNMDIVSYLVLTTSFYTG